MFTIQALRIRTGTRWAGVLALAALLAACHSPPAPGGVKRRAHRNVADGPASVVLVINQASAASREIGAYYARRRDIPKTNVCRINTPPVEQIDRETFATAIERPLAECLDRKRLVEQTRYLVTTLGVPLKIDGSQGPTGEAAAVDSELTLLYRKLNGRDYELAGPVPNPFYQRRDTPFTHQRFPIYLVTRLAAYSVDTVKAIIDRSLEARNRGKVVLDLNSSGDQPGNDWLRTAAILLPEERLVFDESRAVIYGARDVIGYASWGSNDKNRRRRRLGFTWLPGAIATEYVSTNGRTFARPPEEWTFGEWGKPETYFGGSPQSLTADLLEQGATGASGHVYEPFLRNTPRPDYLFPAYLDGRNLAESYYLAIPALSWMNIVIGDPLCRLRPVDGGR